MFGGVVGSDGLEDALAADVAVHHAALRMAIPLDVLALLAVRREAVFSEVREVDAEAPRYRWRGSGDRLLLGRRLLLESDLCLGTLPL